ncbi:MAG: hypothetical protein WDW36_007935 [Sanguina aurantia]
MQPSATASTGPGGMAELPIVTLAKNLNASNVGTGKNLAAISNYYTRLAINDNNFLRVRGYLFAEAGLALSVDNIAVSLGGFINSFFILTKDILLVVTSALAITTSSIALVLLLPSAPTAGVTTAAAAASVSATGRHLLENSTAPNAQDVYSSLTDNMGRIDLLQKGLDTIQTIISMPATAFDGLTPSTFTSVFTERSLANVGLVKMGRGVLATDFKAATPLFFTAQQLAQNQSNYQNFLRYIPTIPIFPLALPGQPNFIGTGLTAIQRTNLAFIAIEIGFAASIISDVAQALALAGDTVALLLRYPALAIQIAQLEISAGLFESTLERDYSPGGAAYADLQRFLTAIDTYRRALGQGSLQSTVTAAQKQLTTARSMLVSAVTPKA